MPWFFSPGKLDSFEEEKARRSLCEARDLGVMSVEVERITGSLGRWRDFDKKFRLTNEATRQRYEVIRRKMREGHVFPPVHLYKVDDHYYVADGNHRVAAAKELGVAYIDAQVQEFFPGGATEEAVYWRERSAFEKATGVTALRFTNPDTYRRMLSHLESFRKEESARIGQELGLHEATMTWLQDIDAPLRERVLGERLKERFPGRTEDDLVFYLIYHHVGLLRAVKGPENVNYRDALRRLLASEGRSMVGRLSRFMRDLEVGAQHLLGGLPEMNL